MAIVAHGDLFPIDLMQVGSIFQRSSRKSNQHIQISCDYNYFRNISDEDRAYWIGFILADGTVVMRSRNGNLEFGLGIGLSFKDRPHLELFKITIKSNHPIHEYGLECGKAIRLGITNRTLCYDLIKHGVWPDKTHVGHGIPDMPQELLSHFIRGYFDGDGSISKRNKEYPGWNLSFEGHRFFLEYITGIIAKECNVNKPKIAYLGGSYNIKWCGTKGIQRIGKYLYHNATVCLSRKEQIFREVINYQSKREKHGKWSLKYDSCVECGTTQKRYAAHGLCCMCYSRMKRGAQKW